MERKRQSKSLEQQIVVLPEREAETPEALLNDVVLQNIFKYLGYKDLKVIRDVKNSIWLRNSKKVWWSRTKVVLEEEKVEKYLNQTEINSCAKNYKLRNLSMGDYNSFWERIGHSIKCLELSFCKFKSVDEFRQIIYTKCPNLEKLVTSVSHIKTDTVAVEPMQWQEPQFGQQKNLKFLKYHFIHRHMPLSWMELLSHFPNLEALEVHTKVDICKVISIIRQHDPKMLKLKHIDIQGLNKADYEESIRLVLLDRNLSFETIRIGNEMCRAESLVEIVDLHAKSLKELCFVGDPAIPIKIAPRQPLLNLEKLGLTDSLFNPDFLRFTPNVRKISINYDGSRNFPTSTESNLRIDTCKELSIRFYGLWRNSPNLDFNFFLNAFPNVEVLEIDGLDNEKFAMICERFTKLKSFIVPAGSLVNEIGLLGFDPDSNTEEARKPNITDLKDLQAFSMRSKLVHGELVWVIDGVHMKNASVVLKELEKLPHLKKFELNNYELNYDQDWKNIFAKYPGEK